MNKRVADFVERVKDKTIHIVGLSGIESYQVAKFLRQHKIKKVICHDFSTQQQFKKKFLSLHLYMPRAQRLAAYKDLLKWPYKRYYRPDYLKGIAKADIVFLSQNWFAYRENQQLLDSVMKNNDIEKSSLTNLYFELANCPIIGVSGSMGKSTTTNIVVEILNGIAESKQGIIGTVHQGGNDRKAGQVLEQIETMSENDVLVLEISNRQLKFGIKASPQVGVLTNIAPNHIEDHKTFEKYIKVKQQLLRHQTDAQIAVLNWDNAYTRDLASLYRRRCILFSASELLGRGVYIQGKWMYLREQMDADSNKSTTIKIMPIDEIGLQGQHNLSNVMAAIGAVFGYLRFRHIHDETVLEQVVEIMRRTVKNLRGLPGRLELIASPKRVDYIYDIKSTIPDETIAAIRSLSPHPDQLFNFRRSHETYTIHNKRGLESASSQKNENNIFLIAGGEDKGVSYDQLAREVVERVKVLFLLPGSGSDKLAASLKIIRSKSNYRLVQASSLTEIFELLQLQTKPGDKVLLSPGCSGFYSKHISGKTGFGELVKRM